MEMLSLTSKIVFISTSVLSAAIMLKFSTPTITDFAFSETPYSFYNGVVSWLKPPYLYLVINCIIITIVASSKLQSKKDDDVALSSSSVAPPSPTHRLPMESVGPIQTGAEYNDVVFGELGRVKEDYGKMVEEDGRREELLLQLKDGTVSFGEDANKENEFVVAKSSWSAAAATGNALEAEYSPYSNMKPPVSARFGHRKNVKASSPEGGKTVLGVSKPKRQDTLESTWKTITEGRAIPLTRHLRKSDTWERDSHGQGGRRPQLLLQRQDNNSTPQKVIKKSETFNDRTNTRSPSPGSSGGSGKLRREPSLTQDELNRRVEAFIKKFNEDMRLQRQESLNQYMEMIKRGSH